MRKSILLLCIVLASVGATWANNAFFLQQSEIDLSMLEKDVRDTVVDKSNYRDVIAALEKEGWTIESVRKDGDYRIITYYREKGSKGAALPNNPDIYNEIYRFELSNGDVCFATFHAKATTFSLLLCEIKNGEYIEKDCPLDANIHHRGTYIDDNVLKYGAKDGTHYIVKKYRGTDKMEIILDHYNADGSAISSNKYYGTLHMCY